MVSGPTCLEAPSSNLKDETNKSLYVIKLLGFQDFPVVPVWSLLLGSLSNLSTPLSMFRGDASRTCHRGLLAPASGPRPWSLPCNENMLTVQKIHSKTYQIIRHRAAACGGTGGVSLGLVRSAGLLVFHLFPQGEPRGSARMNLCDLFHVFVCICFPNL